jgi:acyl-CoA thioester hydrolase
MSADPLDRPCAGRFVEGEHRFAVRVYYEDTDAGGVVYHANYLRFCERARTDMLALAGADIAAALHEGEGGYVVAEAAIKYHAPAKLGDALVVRSRLETVRASACVIQQRVMRDELLVADARLTVAWVGPDGRPRRQPKHWIEAFRGMEGSSSSAWTA